MSELIEKLEASGGVTLSETLRHLRSRPKEALFLIKGRGAYAVKPGNGYLVIVPGPGHLTVDWFHQKLRKALNRTFVGPDGQEFIATPDTLLRANQKAGVEDA